jgi:hypothetical protein
MASTGLDSFTNPAEIGAMYPGPGWEEVMLAVAVVLWVLWHIIQATTEEREYREAVKLYREVGMERAMHHASGVIATEEEVRIKH